MTRKRLSGEIRRNQILEAAFEVFAQKSYSHATTEEIANKAGISQALVFKHYKTKKELFLSCLDKHSKYLTQSLMEILYKEEEVALEEKMNEIFKFFFSYLQEKPFHIKMMLRVTAEIYDPDVRSLLIRHLRDAKGFIAELIQDEIEKGVLRKDLNVNLLSWMFTGGYLSAALILELGVIPDLKIASSLDFLKPFLSMEHKKLHEKSENKLEEG